ncbi:MAG: SUF system NifU family Fe-S cluster assembly protein [Betaproteobacteria bacterium]|nr:SUF system NifU family Fe-S cluster assembly protein [Betaproteobacteria bacterium]
MADLRNLYQEVIFDHNRHPRNFGRIESSNRTAEGHNPLCGDKVKLYLKVEDGVIADAAFEGSGCAISTASASLMTEALKGASVADAERLFTGFRDMVTGPGGHCGLGKLEVLCGVRDFPARVKCATLPWHTLRAALAQNEEPVTTE